jgi:hypothetical protein
MTRFLLASSLALAQGAADFFGTLPAPDAAPSRVGTRTATRFIAGNRAGPSLEKALQFLSSPQTHQKETTMWRTISVAASLLLLLSVSADAEKAKRVEVELGPETHRKTFEDRIEGYETFDYIVPAEAGQSLKVTFKSHNMGAYINIYPPDSDEAMHVGGNRGNRFEGILPETGDYRVHVFLMDNAAHRDEIAKFTIEFVLGSGDAPSKDAEGSARRR